MLKIETTPKGREMLLSNLMIKNHVLGKWISDIFPAFEDEYDKDGNLVAPWCELLTDSDDTIFCSAVTNDTYDKLKDAIEHSLLAYTTTEF